MSLTESLVIGKIRTSHGVKGLLKVISYSGETDHFLKLEEVDLKDRRGRVRHFAVERVTLSGSELLMKLSGVDTPEVGKTFANWEIQVPRDRAAALEEGEFYYADLIGCRLYHGGETLGRVISLVDGGGGTLIEVERPGGEKFFVPFRSEFIGDVDVEAKELELLELWMAEE